MTLKCLVKKYVTVGKNKLYACFVDFKKAFDSVWHKGLFYKLEKMGMGGKLCELIKNIYKKTKCAVKIDGRVTEFFNFTKGVRRGCPLSPLLFNLYVNDIFGKIDNSTVTPPYLQPECPINMLMYADDLVMIARSQDELQAKMSLLSNFCANWNLEINMKKTNIMVFNRGNNLCKANVLINNTPIECVKEYKYLGFNISAKNCSLSNTIVDQEAKANRAIFALNNKIKLSKIPTRMALTIFNTQIKTILLYGIEVWAPYGDYSYETWGKCEVEKCHTQYLKRIMGCDIHAPNLMIRGEFGVCPLMTDAITRSISFSKHLAENTTSLVNQAFLYEKDNNDKNNILQLIRNYNLDVIPLLNTTDPKVCNKKTINGNCKSLYQNIWKNKVYDLPKAVSYNKFKLNYDPEKYISSVKNIKHKIGLCRFRVSSHNLMIEKGRHYRPKLERHDRICPCCKLTVEDECHFLTECPIYTNERNELYTTMRGSSRYFENMTNTDKFIFIMSNEDEFALQKLAKFIFISMKLRTDLLNP